MLNVYAWSVCPHCHRTIEWLKEHRIPFHYLEIEEQPKDVIQKVIDVNGGDDWVVPDSGIQRAMASGTGV